MLKVASWLKQHDYETVLFDCLNPYGRETKGNKTSVEGYDTVVKQKKSIIKLVTGEEEPITPGRRLQPGEKFKFIFGMTPQRLKEKLKTWHEHRDPDDQRPIEFWITSIMTYWWESTRDVIQQCSEAFPGARFRVGGIYPTLAGDHAVSKLGLKRPLLIEGWRLTDPSDPEWMEHDLVVSGEVLSASDLDLDLDLYVPDERPPYTVLTTSRGCPHFCSYCAADKLNYGGRRVRSRGFEAVMKEIRTKFESGIRQFCFYEDNLLMRMKQFKQILKAIMRDNSLKGIELYAPEGIEIAVALKDKKRWLLKYNDQVIASFSIGTDLDEDYDEFGRLIGPKGSELPLRIIIEEQVEGAVQVDSESDNQLALLVAGMDRLLLQVEGNKDLIWINKAEKTIPELTFVSVPEILYLMRKAGFQKIYLPLETVKRETNARWNRSWSKLENFFAILDALTAVGYSTRQQDINAFVMFGLPGEKIEEVIDTALFAARYVGSVIPMLFTPVPSTPVFLENVSFFEQQNLDLHQLNGKLFPFFPRLKEEHDRRDPFHPPLELEDYIRLEALMHRLNTKVLSRSLDLYDGDSRVTEVFRQEYIRYVSILSDEERIEKREFEKVGGWTS